MLENWHLLPSAASDIMGAGARSKSNRYAPAPEGADIEEPPYPEPREEAQKRNLGRLVSGHSTLLLGAGS